MKTFVIAIILLAFISFKSTAQSRAVVELREVIAAIPTKFEKIKGRKFKEDGETDYYTSTLEHAGEYNSVYIMKTPKASRYFINNKWNKTNSDVFKLQMALLGIYQDEINTMVKSGKYTRDDSEKDGTTVTMIRNLEGASVISLMQDRESYYIIIYSWH